MYFVCLFNMYLHSTNRNMLIHHDNIKSYIYKNYRNRNSSIKLKTFLDLVSRTCKYILYSLNRSSIA